MRSVRVVLAPRAEAIDASDAAVVVDVLRATTTLTFALAAGAARVIPAASPSAALELRARHPQALLCGERDGRPIPGFDLGNSPFEYTPARVQGRTLIFASTNGSQALLAARAARRTVLGAFVTASATVRGVQDERSVVIVCAGKLGGFSLEDAACAGWLVRELAARGHEARGAAARMVLGLAPARAEEVRALLEGSAHGRYLRSLGPGFRRDVEGCAEVDALSQVGELSDR